MALISYTDSTTAHKFTTKFSTISCLFFFNFGSDKHILLNYLYLLKKYILFCGIYSNIAHIVTQNGLIMVVEKYNFNKKEIISFCMLLKEHFFVYKLILNLCELMYSCG